MSRQRTDEGAKRPVTMQTVAVRALGVFDRDREFLQCRSSTMDTLPHEQTDLEGDSLTYCKPVETV